jgi:putative transposase
VPWRDLPSSFAKPRLLRTSLTSPGSRREDVFLDDWDRHDFLKTLGETCGKTGWKVHAYCLMANHFHLVVETPNANLVGGMRWLLSTYTIRLNHRHKLFGHVFSGRYKAILVDGSGKGYLRTACDYVHLNPARAKLLRPEDRLLAYPWSSYGLYLSAREHRPKWLRTDRLFGEHGIAADTPKGRRVFEECLERRRREAEAPESVKVFRRGWCLGTQEFKHQMLEMMEGRLGENHFGEQRQETAEARARRIVELELKRRHWSKKDLKDRRKCDPSKLAIAARIRKETTMTVKDIAALLHLGTPRNASVRLLEWAKDHAAQEKTTPAFGL